MSPKTQDLRGSKFHYLGAVVQRHGPRPYRVVEASAEFGPGWIDSPDLLGPDHPVCVRLRIEQDVENILRTRLDSYPVSDRLSLYDCAKAVLLTVAESESGLG